MKTTTSWKIVVLSMVIVCGLTLTSCGKKGPLQRPAASTFQPTEFSTFMSVKTEADFRQTNLLSI